MPFKRRSLMTSAGLALLVGLAGGCGGGDVATSVGAPSAAAPTTTAAGGDCADAQPEIQASLTGMGSITSVEVPSCDKAVVKTGLATADADVAAGICQNAANEASGHGVASVSIVAADGTELATGTTAADCKAVA
jgi:hypothetical protein